MRNIYILRHCKDHRFQFSCSNFEMTSPYKVNAETAFHQSKNCLCVSGNLKKKESHALSIYRARKIDAMYYQKKKKALSIPIYKSLSISKLYPYLFINTVCELFKGEMYI